MDSENLDIITLLDESGSMCIMGSEPVQSVNTFIKIQKKKSDKESLFTLVSFNTEYKYLIKNKKISEVEYISEHSYSPNGSTALNDVICSVIDNKLKSDTPNNIILLIVSDGQENSSKYFSSEDTKNRINNVETNHNWKIIFIGSDINVITEGIKLHIPEQHCYQFDQKEKGNLNILMRTVSDTVSTYGKSRDDFEFKSLYKSISEPIKNKKEYSDSSTLVYLTKPSIERYQSEY